jgi:hypothetical protein
MFDLSIFIYCHKYCCSRDFQNEIQTYLTVPYKIVYADTTSVSELNIKSVPNQVSNQASAMLILVLT